MKMFIAFAMLLGALSLSPAALAFPNASQMKQNFETCVAGDDSWYGRFGQYVVAFDINTATRRCQEGFGRKRSALAACKVNGKWLYAGYYCQERH